MSLKKTLFVVVAALIVIMGLHADAPGGMKKNKMFQTVPAENATILQKGDAKMFCPKCGMTLPMFYKTNHAADVNGVTKQYCSLHCLVEDKESGAPMTNIRVVDVETLKFIPVEKAWYVVGSDVKGTMSMTSKYAFGSKEAAEAFAKKHGGKVMDFNGAYAEAKKDFPRDNAMITKKQTMMAEKGAMIYAKKCKHTDKKFTSPAEAKAFVVDQGLCQGLNPKQLQAVGLYLSHR
jgi:hypothetical protein